MNLQQKIIKPKLGAHDAKHLGNVSAACETMGYNRDSHYRFKDLYKNGGVQKLYRKLAEKKSLCLLTEPSSTHRKSCSKDSLYIHGHKRTILGAA